MPLDTEFPKNHRLIGKHKHADSEHFHFDCGPGRAAEAAENEERLVASTRALAKF